MGKGQSKVVEKEEINMVVPVNAPHLGNDNYEMHQVHSGTLRATGVILIFTIMSFIICAIAIKRLCKHVQAMSSHHAVAIMNHQAQTMTRPPKNVFPDI